MANPYILGQIANPQMADVAGALDYRQKKMQEDEARRKEIKFQQIAGKALSTGLREGSVLHELAMSDPARYMVISKALGVDPANGAEGMSTLDDISSIYAQTVQSVDNGLNYVQNLINSRSELGLDTTRLQAMLDQGKENPTIFKNTIDLMQKTFNPGVSNAITPYQQAQLDLEKGKLDLDKAKFDFKQSSAGGSVIDVDTRQKINKDITPLVKETESIYSAAKSLESLEKSDSPASQLAAVFKFMKSLDPTSAVRETEQGMVYDAQGAAAGLAGRLNKLLGEGGLTKEGFKDVVSTAKTLANSSIDDKSSEISRYLDVYEGTLPEGFVKSLQSRVPKRFEGEQTKNYTGQDKQAYDWAKSNQNDPRAAEILKRLGAQ